MPTVITQRIGPFTQFVMSPETTPGTDAPGGYVLPIRDKVGFQIKQGTTEAPVFNNSILPYSRVYGAITADGNVPLGMEFTTLPAIFKLAMGAPVKTALVTGSLHDFSLAVGVVSLGSAGLQHTFGEATAQYVRAKYCRVKSISTSYAPSGVTPVDVAFVGSGDSATSDNSTGAVDNGYPAVSAFNGQAFINVLQITGMPAFKWNLDTGVAAFPVAFNGGVAASVNPGVINVSGSVELAMATDGSAPENNLIFYNYAVNQQLIPLTCLWANGPLALATKFMEITMPTCYFDRASMTAGGKTGITVSQNFNIVNDTTSKVAAYAFGTVIGPYTIGLGTSDVFAVKIDGGGILTITLTSGAQTVDQIVTTLNANGPFAAVATASNFLGRVKVASKGTTGASTSVQFNTGTANNCAALLGFNNTVIAGYSSPLVVRFWNAQNTAY